MAIELRVEMCAMCALAPVDSLKMMSRATITSSELAGMPRKPSRAACTPSWMSPPRLRFKSSQWSMTVRPNDDAYCIARRMTREFITGKPSSEMATTPAACMAPISANCSPSQSFVMAPIGKTLMGAYRRARSTMKLVTVGLSLTGMVLGMQQTEVKPPAAAARAPVSIVSACSMPGSRKWTWISSKPGETMQSEASRTSASPASMRSPTVAMRPSSINTSRGASVLEAGSTTRPFLISNLLMNLQGEVADLRRHHAHTLSSTAMRTATPFCTWFKITDRGKSATSDEISRPRLIGPGCITIASGFAN